MGDEDIRQALVDAGVECGFASRLVEFVPMAYCRAFLEPAGAQFLKLFSDTPAAARFPHRRR